MLETFLSDLTHLLSGPGLIILFNIIMIDIVMSGDNAILIGMATKKLQGAERKKAIFWGVAGATVLRIVFSLVAVQLMRIPGLEFLGAVLLLYVVWKFYREIRAHEHHDEGAGHEAATLSAAIKTIIIADVAMSLDNVLAVAGNAQHNMAALIIGLIVSIILMVVASGWIARMLEKYPSIQWLGLFIILFTALDMLEKGFGKAVAADTIWGVPESSIFTILLVTVVGGFAVLQTKYLRTDHSAFADWARDNGRALMITLFILLILVTNFGSQVSGFMASHHGYKYGFIMICILGILEILRTNDPEKGGYLTRIWKK